MRLYPRLQAVRFEEVQDLRHLCFPARCSGQPPTTAPTRSASGENGGDGRSFLFLSPYCRAWVIRHRVGAATPQPRDGRHLRRFRLLRLKLFSLALQAPARPRRVSRQVPAAPHSMKMGSPVRLTSSSVCPVASAAVSRNSGGSAGFPIVDLSGDLRLPHRARATSCWYEHDRRPRRWSSADRVFRPGKSKGAKLISAQVLRDFGRTPLCPD